MSKESDKDETMNRILFPHIPLSRQRETDWEAYRSLIVFAKSLQVRVTLTDDVPYYYSYNRAWFVRKPTGQKYIEVANFFRSTADLVTIFAHELGHALSCIYNSLPFASDYWESHSTETLLEEETAWLLSKWLLDAIGHSQPTTWNTYKKRCLLSYYRTPTLSKGRMAHEISLQSIETQALQIWTFPKVSKALDLWKSKMGIYDGVLCGGSNLRKDSQHSLARNRRRGGVD